MRTCLSPIISSDLINSVKPPIHWSDRTGTNLKLGRCNSRIFKANLIGKCRERVQIPILLIHQNFLSLQNRGHHRNLSMQPPAVVTFLKSCIYHPFLFQLQWHLCANSWETDSNKNLEEVLTPSILLFHTVKVDCSRISAQITDFVIQN